MTEPVGVPLVPVTVAVNVTDWPNTDGFCEEATTVVELALLTVCVKLVDVLLLKGAGIAAVWHFSRDECPPRLL